MLNIFQRVSTAVSTYLHGDPYTRKLEQLEEAQALARSQGENPEDSLVCQRLEKQIQRMEAEFGPAFK